MVALEVCRSFRRKPKRLAPVAGQTTSSSPHDNGLLSPELPPSRPAVPSSRSSDRKKTYGLQILYDGPATAGARPGDGVDIVAIHGLNGKAYSTWSHSNGTLWLRDLLPQDLPQSRIYTFGYPAEVFFSKSQGDIIDYSRGLLSEVWGKLFEATVNHVRRPIIFVCHSLGGLVCKQALLLASEPKNNYEEILAATTAIVFLGTPHRGSKIADGAKPLGDFANAVLRTAKITGITGAVRSDLVSALSADSEKLKALASSFHDQLGNIGVVTFYERMITSPLSSLIVDRESAIMGIEGEEVIPLNADHRSMCRFSSRTTEYHAVVNQIRRLARESRFRRDSATISLLSTERRCMSLLYSTNLADYKIHLPRPVQGTCSWILSDDKYMSWISSEKTGVLWVTGDPGCGKTMLSLYLTEHLSLTSASGKRSQVFYFFCDDKVATQRSARDILRSILHQILQQHRRLIKFAKSTWETTGHNLIESFAALWEIFVNIVSESRIGPVGIIVDAIDECEADTRQFFLQSIKELIDDSRSTLQPARNLVKFLLTSRRSPQDLDILSEEERTILPIDGDHARVNQDISLVIKSRFSHIAARANLPSEARAEIEELLYSRAEKSFLWLDIVLKTLEKSLSTSKKSILGIINRFPRQLEGTYTDFLMRIPEEHHDTARRFLLILIGSTRRLALDELNIAYTISQDQYHTTAKIAEDWEGDIEILLLETVGPFVRIDDDRVSLMHQSVKEFFMDHAPSSTNETVRTFAISLVDAALSMSLACVRYLLLDDFAVDIYAIERSSIDQVVDDKGDDSIADPSPLELFPALDKGPLLDVGVDLEEIDFSLVSQRYGFYSYAATNWATHFALCEKYATPEHREEIQRLTRGNNYTLMNWLKFYWMEMDMEYPLPDDFDTVMVAAFFNCDGLLKKCLRQEPALEGAAKNRALFWSARKGCSDSVQVLLKHGADPNFRGLYQQTPLTIAAHFGHLKTVNALLADPRTDINAKGKSGRSALSSAAGNSHVEVVEALFERNECRPDEPDDNGWTSLFWSIERDHTKIARMLLKDARVKINHVDHQGRSALSWAAGEGLLKAIKMILEDPRAEVNLQDSRGRSPLLWAADGGQEKAIDVLCQFRQEGRRVDRVCKDVDQRSALSLACGKAHTDAVKALLKYECGGVDEADVDGWTPLAWALDRRSPSTVEAILSGRGVQLDRKDIYGQTAMMWAASYGYAEIVQILLTQGADPRIATSGLTALDHAKRNNHYEVVELLEQELSKEN